MDRRRSCETWTPFRISVQPRRRLSALLILAGALPAAAWAQTPPQQLTHFTPYADAAYEYDSNLFALANDVPEPLDSAGRPTRSDSFERYKAGFEGTYDWSLQELFGTAEFRQFEYQNFTSLSHSEYLVHGGLRWKADGLLDGVVDYSRERTQVSYLLFNAVQLNPNGTTTVQTNALTQLYLQVQDLATASLNVQFTPEWRLENQAKINDVDSPRPFYPDLAVREDSLDEGFKYTGFANLSAGLTGEYLYGHFTSGEFLLSPSYHQTSVDFAADYTLSGLSVFHGAVGYSSRTQQAEPGVTGQQSGNISGLTGLLWYQRDLTGKTSINLKLSRAINVYITAATPEVDTIAELDAQWDATDKISVLLGYQYQHSSIGATDIVGVISPSRTDNLQTPSLAVRWQVLDWLSLRPYMQYQTRGSTDPAIYNFSGGIYGVQLEVRFGKQPPMLFVRP